MPMYDFEDTDTGKRFSLELSISKRTEYLEENPHIRQILSAPTLVRGTNYGSKMDDGWKENLARISEAHPNSEVAKEHGRKSTSTIKTEQILKKHNFGIDK